MSDLLQQAAAAHQAGNLAEAEKICREVLAAQPGRADAHYNLGMICAQQGRAKEAGHEFLLAAEAKPDFGQAWFMLCEFAAQTGDLELSRRAGEQAIALLPEDPRAWLRLGLALTRLERDEEAIRAFQKVLAKDPGLTAAAINLGVVYKRNNRLAEAESAIRAAIEFSGEKAADENGDYNKTYWYLALIELLRGNYEKGFAHFSARFHGGTDWNRYPGPQPLWKGENLKGKTILVTAEQGYGDTIMFCRYLPFLKKAGARVVFRVQRALMPLLEGWEGADILTPHDEAVQAPFDYHASVLDLPHRFGTVVETIPAKTPYLPLPRVIDERMKLPDDGLPKIAVVWAGQPHHQNDRARSVPLAVFSWLFGEEGCHFYSLNRDFQPGEKGLFLHFPLTNLAPRIETFADSAQLISQCDLVITCDTSMAHLAGALGRKVWTLLPFAPDWRWMLDREDTPWYPTMRLFRQSAAGDWGEVMRRVRAAVHEAWGSRK